MHAVCSCVVVQLGSVHSCTWPVLLCGRLLHGHTGSSGPTAPCVLRYTINILCAVLHYLVLCTALQCVCPAALHLWAVGSGSVAMHCHSACGQGAVELVHLSAAVRSGTRAMHRHTAWRQWVV